MDTIQMNIDEQGNLSTNSLYNLNKQAYDRVLPLNTKDKQEGFLNLYEWVREQRCDYTMLLCHERRDYTIFHYKERLDENYKKGIFDSLKECLENRGRVLDIRYIQNQDAWEIWLRIFKDKNHQNCMYMFFNAEGFVEEV